jgi:hypothetical protein
MELEENNWVWDVYVLYVRRLSTDVFLLGWALHDQLVKAITMRTKHQAIFAKTTARFALYIVEKWERMVLAWEADSLKPNPFNDSTVCEYGCT